ncbi:hypothetical protein [Klebsiella pneumoniae]|uniref:hypothetical protein n=1 Tax=Klebsiella pneumoniae TaxID=573 RepID=UPI001E32D137|nr:hypothetical protein [Klebsiella pneumoniae]
MSAAIAEHSQKMGWLLLKTWIWMLVSIVLFLSATRQGSSGIRGIDSGAASHSQALAEKGGKLKLTQCGKKLEHLCVQISDPNPTVWGKDTYWIVPKGTK